MPVGKLPGLCVFRETHAMETELKTGFGVKQYTTYRISTNVFTVMHSTLWSEINVVLL